MPLTVNSEKRSGIGRKVLSLTADSSYPTGGYALPKTALGFKEIDFVSAEKTGGRPVEYDRDNEKLKFYNSGGTETTNAADLSALTDIRLHVFGR